MSPRRRIAFYSHDTQGLGHVRRNSEIADRLVRANPATDVLLVTGAPEAGALDLPPRTELVVVPAARKDSTGTYSSASLDMPLPNLLALRSDLIAAAVSAFAPDLLIVDKEARGLRGELDETLRRTATMVGVSGRPTRVVLGLRDVLDTDDAIVDEWLRSGAADAIERYYDEVWVYGDPAVSHPIPATLRSPGITERTRFTGYLAHDRARPTSRTRTLVSAPSTPPDPYVLCLVGGGQDGADLIHAFMAADLPRGHHGVVVTGPYLHQVWRDELRLAGRSDVTIHGFVPSTQELIAGAAAVVSMGGYNSVCEVLGAAAPGLIVPRVQPRREQALRAENLEPYTGLDWLPPDRADGTALAAWMADAVQRRRHRHAVDLDGLARIPALVDRLLNVDRPINPVSAVGAIPTALSPAARGLAPVSSATAPVARAHEEAFIHVV